MEIKGYRQLDQKELREVQLGILDAIDAFCVKNNIRYTLAYGTLIGAIRHKGYIPWDDDIDIQMPRPDYERFLKTFYDERGNYAINDYSTNKDYTCLFAKVVDTRTIGISSNLIDNRQVFVDVFPVDGVPSEDNPELYAVLRNIMLSIKRAGKYYKYCFSFRDRVKYFLKYLIKRIYTIKPKVSHNRLKQIVGKYPYGKTPMAGSLLSYWGHRDCMPARTFEEYTDVEFEGRLLKSVKEYDAYLRRLYGDYMTPPPEDKRQGEHFKHAFIQIENE